MKVRGRDGESLMQQRRQERRAVTVGLITQELIYVGEMIYLYLCRKEGVSDPKLCLVWSCSCIASSYPKSSPTEGGVWSVQAL